MDGETTKRQWVMDAVADYEGPLLAYARRRLGDPERARDVVQDVFLGLWKQDQAKVAPFLARWLYTACRNRTIDVHRKECRMTVTDRGPVVATPAPDETGWQPEIAEHSAGVLAMVTDLPPRQQEALRLRFHGGLSYVDIAEVMETTVNNVGVLLHHAIRTLRTKLTPENAA